MVAGDISANKIRSAFSSAMSEMYRHEVPAYGALVEPVASASRKQFEADLGVRVLDKLTEYFATSQP